MSTVISLQSVGLGAFFDSVNKNVAYAPIEYKVGEKLVNSFGCQRFDSSPKIEKIYFYDVDEANISFANYQVETSDGNTRILPADKFIAEYKEQK